MPSIGAIVVGTKRPPRVRRYLRLAAVISAIVLASLLVAYFLFQRATGYSTPSGHAPGATLIAGDRELRFGDNRLFRRGGLWVTSLFGSPWEIGYARGRLTAGLGDPGEAQLRAIVSPSASGWLGQTWQRMSARWRNRDLAGSLPDAMESELAGLAQGLSDAETSAPSYRQLIYEQVVWDHGQQPISLRSADPRRVTRWGVAFAGRGSAAAGAHVVVGAALRLDADTPLEAVLDLVHSDEPDAIPYAALRWPGQAGAFAGLNRDGIAIVIVPARSSDAATRSGVPVGALGREVLSHASTLAKALELVRAQKPLAAASIVLAAGREGESMIVERTPRRLAIRRDNGDGGVYTTGHLVAPEFESDGDNDRLRRYGVSAPRYQRLGELMRERRGAMEPARALEILRDRHGPGGIELPLGHPAALAALEGERPLIIDASAMVLWAGEGPGALGPLRALDLRHELGSAAEVQGSAGAPPADLGPDPLLGAPAYADYLTAAADLATAHRLAREGHPRLALDAVQRALAFAPNLPAARKLAGDLLRGLGDGAGAHEQYQQFLKLAPPFLDDVEEVRAYLGIL